MEPGFQPRINERGKDRSDEYTAKKARVLALLQKPDSGATLQYETPPSPELQHDPEIKAAAMEAAAKSAAQFEEAFLNGFHSFVPLTREEWQQIVPRAVCINFESNNPKPAAILGWAKRALGDNAVAVLQSPEVQKAAKKALRTMVQAVINGKERLSETNASIILRECAISQYHYREMIISEEIWNYAKNLEPEEYIKARPRLDQLLKEYGLYNSGQGIYYRIIGSTEDQVNVLIRKNRSRTGDLRFLSAVHQLPDWSEIIRSSTTKQLLKEYFIECIKYKKQNDIKLLKEYECITSADIVTDVFVDAIQAQNHNYDQIVSVIQAVQQSFPEVTIELAKKVTDRILRTHVLTSVANFLSQLKGIPGIYAAIVTDSAIRTAALERATAEAEEGFRSMNKNISLLRDVFGCDQEQLAQVADTLFKKAFSSPTNLRVLNGCNAEDFHFLSEAELQSIGKKHLTEDFLRSYFNQGIYQQNIDSLENVILLFKLNPDAVLLPIVFDYLFSDVNSDTLDINTLEFLKKRYPSMTPDKLSDPVARDAWEFYEDTKIPLKIRQAAESYGESYTLQARRARLTHMLSPHEYTAIAQQSPDSLEKVEDRVAALERVMQQEDGHPGIIESLHEGASVFGAQAMLAYMNRVEVSRHDSLYFMTDLIELFENSGLSPEAFSQNILLQVARDTASYEEGHAHHRLASIVQHVVAQPIPEILERAKRYETVGTLQELVAEIEAQSPFSSWKMLKKFDELNEMLKRSEILDDLQADNLSPKLRRYIERLAFHPNVSADAVIQFWRDPAAFLDIDDEHTTADINRGKKPSNLLSLPFLGLKAEDLRDALVEGTMDRVQVIQPHRKDYYFGIPTREDVGDDPSLLHYTLRKALGERSQGIAGVAISIKKLFQDIQQWSKRHGLQWQEVWDNSSGPKILAAADEEIRKELCDLLYQPNSGIRGQKEPFQHYRAEIGAKSDPEMVVAGNDTACCMPFGSGKNTAYTFNPTYAQMVLQRKTADGRWRTAAQSVLSIDHTTTENTPTLIQAYKENGAHIKDLVKPGDLTRERVLTCDNIEVAKNEEGDRLELIHDIYRDFFIEYLARYADQLQVSRQSVPIGTGYTPSELGFRKKENHHIPVAPAGYSDNVHEECYVIDTAFTETEQQFESMEPFTAQHALLATVLEGKAYDDNESLISNLHHMQNCLIGMQIANQHFDRPNLSFLHRDTNTGQPKGYILAYEGVVKDMPMVFLDDLATDRTKRQEGSRAIEMAGGRLIQQFFDAYAQNYGDGKRPYLPIYTNARESTSYPILMRHAHRLGKKLGVLTRVVEVDTNYRGQDMMHNMMILIGTTEDELNAQETQFRVALQHQERDDDVEVYQRRPNQNNFDDW